jgi:hypothetical protein
MENYERCGWKLLNFGLCVGDIRYDEWWRGGGRSNIPKNLKNWTMDHLHELGTGCFSNKVKHCSSEL